MPRGETVDGRQRCNDGELASLRYHGGRIRLFVAAAGPRNSRMETGGGDRRAEECARVEANDFAGEKVENRGETEGLFRPRTEPSRPSRGLKRNFVAGLCDA